MFSVVFSLLGCVPVPPQNRYFKSPREWYLHFKYSCLANLIMFIPNGFHSKFLFLAPKFEANRSLLCRKDLCFVPLNNVCINQINTVDVRSCLLLEGH